VEWVAGVPRCRQELIHKHLEGVVRGRRRNVVRLPAAPLSR
jgi:hypothetical protein